MTQEVSRWLAEVRTLQHQLATAHQERDQAYASAANWRKLYDAEAKQRRTDVEQLQLTIATLRTEVSTLQRQLAQEPQSASPAPVADTAGTPNLDTVDGLRAHLADTLRQCDRLQQQLDEEREDHAQTRQTLTTALGEAIDSFKREEGLVHQPQKGSAE
jgi:predicted RNase H-like nuclease (RuvC/YqgF family)